MCGEDLVLNPSPPLDNCVSLSKIQLCLHLSFLICKLRPVITYDIHSFIRVCAGAGVNTAAPLPKGVGPAVAQEPALLSPTVSQEAPCCTSLHTYPSLPGAMIDTSLQPLQGGLLLFK